MAKLKKKASAEDSNKADQEKLGSISRLTLRIPLKLTDRLEELREITFASNTNEVIKNALLFYDTLIRERQKGNEIAVISPEGDKKLYSIFVN